MNSAKMNGHTNGYSAFPNGHVNGNSISPMHDDDVNIYTYEVVDRIAKYLLSKTDKRPKIGIICGSGLGNLAESLTETHCFPYEHIPEFPISTVSGHAGQLVFGLLDNMPVLCMQGRFHFYEGYPIWKCSMPVRVMKLVGITHLIVTNAAGGLEDNYRTGDIMILKDHVNFLGLSGTNPLRGPNEDKFGVRFPPMNKAYDAHLRRVAKKVAKDMGIENHVHEGVYACVGGPSYETIAELRMMKMMGINAVGMSTVHEIILARHCDLTVFCFSLITNECITDYDCEREASHEEVMQSGRQKQEVLKQFVTLMVKNIMSIIEK